MDPGTCMDSTDPVRTAAVVRDPVRLDAVAALRVAAAEPWCDELTASARAHLGTAAALVSIVERHRQCFPGAAGLPQPWQRRRATLLTYSFCQYVVGSGRPLVVTDARRHPVLRDNAAISDPGVVAYAGAPIVTDRGHVLGAFCVTASSPRSWTHGELTQIAAYAARCGRHFSRRQITIADRPDPPPGRPPAPADISAPGPLAEPWTDSAVEPDRGGPQTSTGRPTPIRADRDEVVFAGRYHAEAATIKIRIADTAEASARFAHRIHTYVAFGQTPPPVVAGAYRWSDNNRILVLSGGPERWCKTTANLPRPSPPRPSETPSPRPRNYRRGNPTPRTRRPGTSTTTAQSMNAAAQEQPPTMNRAACTTWWRAANRCECSPMAA